MLNALMQISLNGPHNLSDEQANTLEKKWLGKKQLKVIPRGLKDVLTYGEKMENRKMKVQESEAENDEDLDFEDFAENDANMVAGLDRMKLSTMLALHSGCRMDKNCVNLHFAFKLLYLK